MDGHFLWFYNLIIHFDAIDNFFGKMAVDQHPLNKQQLNTTNVCDVFLDAITEPGMNESYCFIV